MCLVDNARECNLVSGCIVLQTSVYICSFDVGVLRLVCIGAIARSRKLVFSQEGTSGAALSLPAGPFGYGYLE